MRMWYEIFLHQQTRILSQCNYKQAHFRLSIRCVATPRMLHTLLHNTKKEPNGFWNYLRDKCRDGKLWNNLPKLHYILTIRIWVLCVSNVCLINSTLIFDPNMYTWLMVTKLFFINMKMKTTTTTTTSNWIQFAKLNT